MSETKDIFVVYTNTDCTEGRGVDIPIAFCEVESTARRLSKKKYVQGSDGPVRIAKAIKVDGIWYFPMDKIYITRPSEEDEIEEEKTKAKNLAMEKVKAAGITDDDLKALGLL